ncbi:MAG TPA: hypothetical protein VJZ71_12360 [Phycisphaerae bacterium]|nr:hypothetical protein [Phycisphaerae bacterium]
MSLLAVEMIVRRSLPALQAYDIAIYQRAQDGLGSADRPEIILMGSSRARFALDPSVFEEILGRSAYNVALSGSKVVEWSVLVRRLFEDYTPRAVVIGINAGEVRAEYLPTEAALHLFEFDDLRESIYTDGFSLDVVGAYARRSLGPWCKTYDHRYEILSWGQERLAAVLPKHAQLARELRERAAAPRPPSGYDHPWSHGRRLKDLLQKEMDDYLSEREFHIPHHRPDASTFVRLNNLLHELQGRGIRVVVAYIPNSPRTEERWRDVEARMIGQIARTCRAQGVLFLHWDQAQMPRSDQDYLDETHVGWPLACELSRRIAEQIESLALLEDPTPSARLASSEVEP